MTCYFQIFPPTFFPLKVMTKVIPSFVLHNCVDDSIDSRALAAFTVFIKHFVYEIPIQCDLLVERAVHNCSSFKTIV